jgi:hypothetical protein
LSKKNIGRFNRLMPQIGEQHKITNLSPNQSLVQPTKRRSAVIRFVQIRQSSQSSKYLTNSRNSSELVWNATQDRVHPLEIPFGYNVRGCRVRVCRNVIVRVTLKFRVEVHQISSPKTLPQCSNQIFCIKIGVKVNQIALSINSQRVCRSILMQRSKMNQTQPPQQERKQIVETKETIQGRVVNTKTTPLPTNNTCTNYGQSTCLTRNNSPSPKRHLQIYKNRFRLYIKHHFRHPPVI